ncbi:MAG: DUF6293 family protein [Thermoplasmatota archaeon]
MDYPKHLRVVISCVTFETVKIVKPVMHFQADLVYLLHHNNMKQPYTDFLDEVVKQLKEKGIEYKTVEVDLFHFEPLMRTLIGIMDKEKEKGNHIFVNMEAGTSIYSAASLIASMMKDAITFNVGTKVFQVRDPAVYYDNDRPVGLAKDVKEPFILPRYRIKEPNREQVRALSIWKEVLESFGTRQTRRVIRRLEEEGLMKDTTDDRGKVTHGANMKFRRKYLKHWLGQGWVSSEGSSNYHLTDNGMMVLDIFGDPIE